MADTGTTVFAAGLFADDLFAAEIWAGPDGGAGAAGDDNEGELVNVPKQRITKRRHRSLDKVFG